MALDEIFKCQTSVHNLSIHHTALGSTSSPPLIFIHGTPWSHKVWLPYAQSFAADYRVYLFDNPGYGVSPLGTAVSDAVTPEEDLDAPLTSQAEGFSQLFQHWRERDSWTQNPHVIAHDNAGLVSLRANIQHACDYASLCLIDVVAIQPFGSPFFQLAAQNESVFAAIPANMFKGFVHGYIADAAYKRLPDDVMDMLMEPWMEQGTQGPHGFLRQMIQAHGRHARDVEARFHEVGAKMPVKVIWGKQDQWLEVERAARLAEMVGAKELVLLGDAGHLVHYDQPERLGVELGLWIGKVG
jgi:pimeloyl-ACP methyl ester carboxylesterase